MRTVQALSLHGYFRMRVCRTVLTLGLTAEILEKIREYINKNKKTKSQ